MIIRVDYHYQSLNSFDDSIEHENDRGYFYQLAEQSNKCYRFQFDNLDEFFNFFLNDFSETVDDNSTDFVCCNITFEKK